MIYTIGFTKKHASEFFNIIKSKQIDLLIDIRLNNTSQLAAFSKYPDIKYFLKVICEANYVHDTNFAPTQELLKSYKDNKISWSEYESIFSKRMQTNRIEEYIKEKYHDYSDKNICLLCTESTPDKCHRRLVADIFSEVFQVEVSHL